MEDKSPNTEGQPVTDYLTKYDITADQLSKIKDKFKKDKDFPNPSTDAEKEFALDWLIEQLVEVKKEQWGKPVKLD
jgi:hypothetical protein